MVSALQTNDFIGKNPRFWRMYACGRCGGVITASAQAWDAEVRDIYPAGTDVNTSIPDRARSYLDQAINSLSSPAGAVMLAASVLSLKFVYKSARC